jgi:DNA-binding CsgD family transcriptional regulator
MKLKNKQTWLNYLESIKCSSYESDGFQLTGFDDFINANGFAQSFFRHSVPFVYLLDYRTGLYINMSENFAGYKAECFLKEGVNHTLEIYQRDHLQLFNKHIFPDRLNILQSIAPENHKNYVFSYNWCVKNRNGQPENLLQRSCFLSDKSGNPMFSMGMLININNFGSALPIVQTVDEININGAATYQTIYKKVYQLNDEDKLFTRREIEVLLWMAEGFSSKMIADKLFISEHTVINHRRSMLDKTNKPNAIALVSFAIKNGLV